MKKACLNSELLTEDFPTVVDNITDTPYEVGYPLYWVDCNNESVQIGWYYKDGEFLPPPIPTPAPPTADKNKAIAVQKLKNTDWVELPSVSATTSNPYLTNVSDFVTYRDAVRVIAVNPTAGILEWPVKPVEQWSS
jgi:hypothetical protein